MLIVSASLSRAPFLAGWQEFKDELRKATSRQPGWTDVKDKDKTGLEKEGWCRIDQRDDAERAYERFAKKKHILVHLFRTSRRNSDYRLLKCNCGRVFTIIGNDNGHSRHLSGLHQGSVNEFMAQHTSLAAPNTTLPQYMAAPPQVPMYSYSGYHQPLVYSPYQAPPAQNMYRAHTYPAPVPVYQSSTYTVPQYMPQYTSSTGLPANGKEGIVLTESRGVVLTNLSCNTTYDQLDGLLFQIRQPLERNLHTDNRAKNRRGHATAQYACERHAREVVARLNNTEFLGRIISVRLDTDTVVTAEPQGPPVIAIGTITRA